MKKHIFLLALAPIFSASVALADNGHCTLKPRASQSKPNCKALVGYDGEGRRVGNLHIPGALVGVGKGCLAPGDPIYVLATSYSENSATTEFGTISLDSQCKGQQ